MTEKRKTGKYEIAYCDFPWPYTSFGTAKLPYGSMTEEEVAGFDWSQFLSPRAAVFSWVTCPKLDVAMRCAEAWRANHGLHFQGVAYIWVKTKKDGTPIGASGPRPRFVKPLDELLLVFSTRPRERVFKLLSEKQVQHVFEPKQQQHSRKPDVFRNLIVDLLGDRPRIELFARGLPAEGWDSLGEEDDWQATVR